MKKQKIFKKEILVMLLTLIVSVSLMPMIAFATRYELLYVLKDDFVDSDHVLVIRTAPLYKYELWVIEYGIGCSSMWRFENKSIIATYNNWLDGIGGKLILPKSGSCRNWDAKKIEDSVSDFRQEDWQWLQDNGYLSD